MRPELRQKDPETVELGLRILALSGGNCKRASELMLDEGKSVDPRTLRDWKDTRHAARYEQIVDEIRRELDQETKDVSAVLAAQAQHVEQAVVRRLQANLHEVPARDLSAAARNLAQTAQINVGINRLLNEKPNVIIETRDPSEILAELKDLGVIEGSAEEVEGDGRALDP